MRACAEISRMPFVMSPTPLCPLARIVHPPWRAGLDLQRPVEEGARGQDSDLATIILLLLLISQCSRSRG